MHDCKVTPAMASAIKLARSLGIPYSWITGYYHGLNFGRIADVMKGRLFPTSPQPGDFRLTSPTWRGANMANFLVTYDLNGPYPSHKQMDDAISRLGVRYARVLETVWWLEASNTAVRIRDHLQSILGAEDLLLVIDCKGAAWTKLLIDSEAFKNAFNSAA